MNGGPLISIVNGFDADLVVLDGDPSEVATALAEVRYTIRGGKVIYPTH